MSDSSSRQDQIQIVRRIAENHQYLNDRLDLDLNYDIDYRTFKIGNRKINIYYVNSLNNTDSIIQLLRQIASVDKSLSTEGAFKELVEHTLVHVQVEIVESMDEVIDNLLAGLIVVFGEAWKKAIVVDVREYPGRNPEEPDTERVVRGARDGYTENIIMNTGLTRRRIRDERLRMEMIQVGERSKTDICISYIQDIADAGLVQEIKDRINRINIDGIPMGEKAIEEFVINQRYNLFPKVRFTERPDVAAAICLKGM